MGCGQVNEPVSPAPIQIYANSPSNHAQQVQQNVPNSTQQANHQLIYDQRFQNPNPTLERPKIEFPANKIRLQRPNMELHMNKVGFTDAENMFNDDQDDLKKPMIHFPNKIGSQNNMLYTKVGSSSSGNNEAFNNGFMCQVRQQPKLARQFYQQSGNPESFNNLGSMSLSSKNYHQALSNYSKAIEKSRDPNPLFYINRGVTHNILNNYQLAENDFRQAQKLLHNKITPNNLSAQNIKFIDSQLKNFRQIMQKIQLLTVQLTQQQQQKLNEFKVSFVNNMKNIFAEQDVVKELSGNDAISNYIDAIQKTKEKQYNQLVCQLLLLQQTQNFSENCLDKIAEISYNLFKINHQNFQPVPFHFLVLFIKKFKIKKDLQSLDNQIEKMVAMLTQKYPATTDLPLQKQKQIFTEIHLKQPKLIPEVNLFKNKFFTNHKALLKEISDIHERSYKQLDSFKELAQGPCSKYGQKFKYNCKMPPIQKKVDYFKVFIRICQKIMKKSFNKESLLKKVLLKIQEKPINIQFLIQTYFNAWTEEIDNILIEKKKKRQQLSCNVYDFIRGKCQFKTLKAINSAANEIISDCQIKKYQIIQIDNRLKKNTQDLVFKIKIRQAVAELQLALAFDSEMNQYNHCLYEIKRSPLGSIFGSLLWLGKIKQLKFLNRISQSELSEISFDKNKYQNALDNAVKAYKEMRN